jgi:hypothetical protein
MSQANRTANNVEPFFHPVSHYGSPDDVLDDAKLSTEEKRLILSSWASDMYAVESHPALREVPGIPRRLRLDDILAALKQLDDETDPPPRGGLAMRLPRLSKLDSLLTSNRSALSAGTHRRGGIGRCKPRPHQIIHGGPARQMCGDTASS